MRVGYPKIRRIAAGDILHFTSEDASLNTGITDVKEYGSFQALLEAEDAAAIGGPDMTPDQLTTAIRAIYPPEKEALGVFALHLTRLPE
ncbi:acetyltransferase [Streptomyces iconiensis]|uniref:Acetyltransferase n=1 Tax=Streptomyces iconiensis TaxID=1384038 RepID=A0ABT7A254_9ACTN|nr:acetyltransferase [Streptomyces iconiensis]MDJ1135428.1 acetyltransferase [Streptomyces iconiensis]